MIVQINHKDKIFEADLSQPIDISIGLEAKENQPNCFYAPSFETEAVRAGDFVGDVKQGGPVNFLNVKLNPHGNGTHTECIGHISKEANTINKSLETFHFLAKLHTIRPVETENGDQVITRDQLEKLEFGFEAALIRTIPNDPSKKERNYSGSNPPYFENEAIQYLLEQGIQHLLIDLPSVDREEDDGKVVNHKTFWNYPECKQSNKTITELVFIENEIKDGLYLLHIMIAPFEIDASPSKPVLYKLIEKT